MIDILNKITGETARLKDILEVAKDIDISSGKIESMDYKVVKENRLKKEIREKFSNLKAMQEILDKSSINRARLVSDRLKRLVDDFNRYESRNHRQRNRQLLETVTKIGDLIPDIPKATSNSLGIVVESIRFPEEIRDDMQADFRELIRCFENNCFRASTIICGRILETALHRKYYDVTGKDILETNPGIGLGKLIAKLKENKGFFDPGLMDQIHLINKVRIYSVHRKQEVFEPSREHTNAVVLYTIDIVKRMF